MLVTTTPQDAPHAHTVQRLAERLVLALEGRAIVRVQSPLALADDSEPEPDVAVVPLGNYSSHHPTRAHLVIEVAMTSARRDRFVKAPLYARAGVPEYWSVDVTSRTVRVCRRPSGPEYQDTIVHAEHDHLGLEAFPDVEIAISFFLPRRG